jgi:twitching motility protein PilT
MATIQIDRLLETTVRRKASDLHLAVGRPPTLRMHGHLRELQTKVLEAEDTVALMKSITPSAFSRSMKKPARATLGLLMVKRRDSASPSSSRRDIARSFFAESRTRF